MTRATSPSTDLRTGPLAQALPGSRAEHDLLDNLFDELFPICRSITGPGLRQSLDILARFMPLKPDAIESGSQVFDWVVPQEWRMRSGRLTGPDGTVLADFETSNLQVVNYSEPIDDHISHEALKAHLHSLPHVPNAVPYVFSYYQRNWGFCLPDNVRRTLPTGDYHVQIDSNFVDGQLDFADLVLPGESEKEILLTSYLCHPSMANNELSGPLVLLALYNRLARRERRYTYRLALHPETIGAICYLHRHGEYLRERLAGGLVLTCLGGPSERLTYKRSRQDNALIDQVMDATSGAGDTRVDIRSFTPENGSDERHYCSPGFNFPMGQMARTVYSGEADWYHTSLDTKDFMRIDSLMRSADEINQLLRTFEHAGHFQNLYPYGEPQLGRRNLYPHVNNYETWKQGSADQPADPHFRKRMLFVLNYSDGDHTMLDIAERCGCKVADLIPVIGALEQAGLVQQKF